MISFRDVYPSCFVPSSTRRVYPGRGVHSRHRCGLVADESCLFRAPLHKRSSRKRAVSMKLTENWSDAARAMESSQAQGWMLFTKYEGLGNDFILIDQRQTPWRALSTSQAVRLCDRHRGVGADGVIMLLPATSADADFSVRILNADGSEPEMCGNGIRCVAKYVVDQKNGFRDASATRAGNGEIFRIETGAGRIQPQVLPDGRVCVDMGLPVLDPRQIPTTLSASQHAGDVRAVVDALLDVGSDARAGKRLPTPPAEVSPAAGFEWRCTAVSMGNPHCVIFVNKPTFAWIDANLESLGPLFENHAAFPRRTNTEFIEVCGPRELRMLVWERGAGRTMACGTGACASVVAAIISGRIPPQHEKTSDTTAADNCIVHLPGGDLEISWSSANQHVYMTGPAKFVYRGEFVL
ncbi:hypothetical protein CCYA_CCYA03G0967 [Cyanidiococcus yangmingshanensis]|nr:hypothetical protein CCYA_CCYA03G0967 [Cyanidiococcus yangmingshanensis]